MNYENRYIDDYFRQHEQEIPVPYDPEQWTQLAAMLDASDSNLPSTMIRKSPLVWRIGGLLLVALIVSFPFRQQNPPPSTIQIAPTPVLDSQHQVVKSPVRSIHKIKQPVIPAPPVLEEREIAPNQTPLLDSTNTKIQPEHHDSVKALPKPLKKKKHLFW